MSLVPKYVKPANKKVTLESLGANAKKRMDAFIDDVAPYAKRGVSKTGDFLGGVVDDTSETLDVSKSFVRHKNYTPLYLGAALIGAGLIAGVYWCERK